LQCLFQPVKPRIFDNYTSGGREVLRAAYGKLREISPIGKG
jgi:hypothetical protein